MRKQETDYFGVVSGNREPKKFENSGLTASKSEVVDAPVINEFPICMERGLVKFQGEGCSYGVIGKLIRITAGEQIMQGLCPTLLQENETAEEKVTDRSKN